ncbi:MAG: hypothetical protein H7070_15450 [Saprospiraceae bacterium]|nr:hypothetical protein [Pyrinomonadaceae bacterium]
MFQPIFLAFCIFFSISAFAQLPVEQLPIVGVSDIYLARDNGEGQAGEAADNFITTDVPIYCVVKLVSADPANVQMNFIAVSVPGVKAETKVVSANFKTDGLYDRVNFTGRPAGFWVAGKYRVDIFVNKILAGSKDLDIKKAANAPQTGTEAAKPRSFVRPTPSLRARKN